MDGKRMSVRSVCHSMLMFSTLRVYSRMVCGNDGVFAVNRYWLMIIVDE